MSEFDNYNPNTPNPDQAPFDPNQVPTQDQFENAADNAMNFINQSDDFASSYIQQTMPEAMEQEPTELIDNMQQGGANINQQFQQYQQSMNQRAQQVNAQFQQYQQNQPYQAYQNPNGGYSQPGAGGGYNQPNPNMGYNQPTYGGYGGTPTYQGQRSGPFEGGFSTGYDGGADTAWKNQAAPGGGMNQGYASQQGTSQQGPYQQNNQAGPYSYNPNPYGNPAGYQQPYQKPGARAQDDPGYTMGLISMILGIASCVLFLFGSVGAFITVGLGVSAIILGVLSGKKSVIQRNGYATTGLVCGIIGVALGVIAVACWACAGRIACAYLNCLEDLTYGLGY